MRGESLFITGGSGFVGSWLLESLLRACDRFDLGLTVALLTRNPERFRAAAPHSARHPAVRIIAGDCASFAFPAGSFPWIVHAATEPGVDPDAARPLGVFDPNIAGTRRVLEFARVCGARRLLLTSSGAVYGRQASLMTHIDEDYSGAPATTDPGSAYGQAKRICEYMGTMYSRAYGYDVLIARLFAFVGPRLPLDANFAVGNFIGDALRGSPIQVGGDGTPYRSYLYAADLAIWLWTILFRGKSAYPYNVGSPQDLTIAELAATIRRVVAPELDIRVARNPIPGAPPARYVPSTERAHHELGLEALIPLESGIRKTCEWHREARVAASVGAVA